MTKTEIKEYLKKIYSVKVIEVATANFLGKISTRTTYLLIASLSAGCIIFNLRNLLPHT